MTIIEEEHQPTFQIEDMILPKREYHPVEVSTEDAEWFAWILDVQVYHGVMEPERTYDETGLLVNHSPVTDQIGAKDSVFAILRDVFRHAENRGDGTRVVMLGKDDFTVIADAIRRDNRLYIVDEYELWKQEQGMLMAWTERMLRLYDAYVKAGGEEVLGIVREFTNRRDQLRNYWDYPGA